MGDARVTDLTLTAAEVLHLLLVTSVYDRYPEPGMLAPRTAPAGGPRFRRRLISLHLIEQDVHEDVQVSEAELWLVEYVLSGADPKMDKLPDGTVVIEQLLPKIWRALLAISIFEEVPRYADETDEDGDGDEHAAEDGAEQAVLRP